MGPGGAADVCGPHEALHLRTLRAAPRGRRCQRPLRDSVARQAGPPLRARLRQAGRAVPAGGHRAAQRRGHVLLLGVGGDVRAGGAGQQLPPLLGRGRRGRRAQGAPEDQPQRPRRQRGLLHRLGARDVAGRRLHRRVHGQVARHPRAGLPGRHQGGCQAASQPLRRAGRRVRRAEHPLLARRDLPLRLVRAQLQVQPAAGRGRAAANGRRGDVRGGHRLRARLRRSPAVAAVPREGRALHGPPPAGRGAPDRLLRQDREVLGVSALDSMVV
mmetsp:Transcript_16822/g.44453  ORF Transcript_16822/g.44453 Transcript_16822/m.44453 type:complete len:272 (+) Transcript_16822:195-1010(+)